MPVIKKPRYVAQIKGERRSPFSPPPFPLLLPFFVVFFPSSLSLSLSALFFLLPAVACSVAQGRFISDEIVGKMSSRTERCKCASGGRLLASPVRKMNPDQGSSPLGKKTRPDSLKWLANLPYFTPRFGPTPIENCRSSDLLRVVAREIRTDDSVVEENACCKIEIEDWKCWNVKILMLLHSVCIYIFMCLHVSLSLDEKWNISYACKGVKLRRSARSRGKILEVSLKFYVYRLKYNLLLNLKYNLLLKI